MAYETVLYEVDEGHVATVTLNRPEVLNAFNQLMADELSEVWQSIRRDSNVHAVVLCAAGDKGFCAGLDMRGAEARIVVGLGFRRCCGLHRTQAQSGVEAGGDRRSRLLLHGRDYFLNESDIVIACQRKRCSSTSNPSIVITSMPALRRAVLVPVLRW